jgi:hypothetical protein
MLTWCAVIARGGRVLSAGISRPVAWTLPALKRTNPSTVKSLRMNHLIFFCQRILNMRNDETEAILDLAKPENEGKFHKNLTAFSTTKN